MNPLVTSLLAAIASQVGIRIPLDSSCVASLGVSGGGVVVTLHGGHEYPIDVSDAIGLLTASSAGRYFNEYIKGRI
jgi:hypothetical protein